MSALLKSGFSRQPQVLATSLHSLIAPAALSVATRSKYKNLIHPLLPPPCLSVSLSSSHTPIFIHYFQGIWLGRQVPHPSQHRPDFPLSKVSPQAPDSRSQSHPRQGKISLFLLLLLLLLLLPFFNHRLQPPSSLPLSRQVNENHLKSPHFFPPLLSFPS